MGIGFSETSIVFIDPPKLPDNIPYVIDDCSLAFQLGFRNKTLWFLVIKANDHYKVYRIPKSKPGEYRIIHAPSPIMKLISQQLLVKFLTPLQKELGKHVTAYRPNLSARQAVEQHIHPCPICDAAPEGETPKKHDCPRRGTYIHMDLRDFFPSTSRAKVRNYFLSIGYNHMVSDLLAGLTTVRDIPNPRYRKHQARKNSKYNVPEFFAGVPQGAPSSGAICNLVADQLLDRNIIEYLSEQNKQLNIPKEKQWRYTRYSDDLSFTCGLRFSYTDQKQILKDLTKIVIESGYRINRAKTRFVSGYHQRRLLGMTCNEKPNIPKELYLKFRALLYNCMIHGFETQYERAKQPDSETLIGWLRGKVNWFQQINANRGGKLRDQLQLALLRYEEERSERFRQTIHDCNIDG